MTNQPHPPCDAATVEFTGRARLIAAIDRAVVLADAHAVTSALRRALCELIADPEVDLPPCVREPVHDHYARREIYRSQEHGYSVVAMTWGPGQATPLHDHNGLWCVEGVWQGDLEITQYELLERDGERYRFAATGGIQAGPGSAGSLIPPHEFHTIRNPSAHAIAITVHIYKGPMDCCSKFHPTEVGGWYERERSILTTDAVT